MSSKTHPYSLLISVPKSPKDAQAYLASLPQDQYIKLLELIISDLLDGEKVHDIHGNTCLPLETCEAIYSVGVNMITKVMGGELRL